MKPPLLWPYNLADLPVFFIPLPFFFFWLGPSVHTALVVLLESGNVGQSRRSAVSAASAILFDPLRW